jgi:adenosylcobinamide kinase/adenosylcobinamide-phosphate guanylyltransferase
VESLSKPLKRPIRQHGQDASFSTNRPHAYGPQVSGRRGNAVARSNPRANREPGDLPDKTPGAFGAYFACQQHGGCDGAIFCPQPYRLLFCHGAVSLMADISCNTVFILGGARSGKSAFAERLSLECGLARHYVATGRAWDDEMTARIAHHRESRGEGWATHEEPLDLVGTLRRIDRRENVVLVDCLTLWVTNLMMEQRDMAQQFAALAAHVEAATATLILVSNEVGLGIVPENRMARDFRDHAGRLHQSIAAKAREVYFVAAGLPLKMKG